MLTDLILIDEAGDEYLIQGDDAQVAFKKVLMKHKLKYEIILANFKVIIKRQKN